MYTCNRFCKPVKQDSVAFEDKINTTLFKLIKAYVYTYTVYTCTYRVSSDWRPASMF